MKTIILSLIILALASSCLPKMGKTALNFNGPKNPIRNDITPDPADERSVNFETLKAEVLEPKCIKCHTHAAWKDELAFQSKYIVLGSPDTSKLFDSVLKGRMPKGPKLPDGTREVAPPLTSVELETVRLYIQQATKVYPNVNYEELKTQILIPKCMGCHKRWTTEELFQKDNVIPGKFEKSRVYDSVTKERMPKPLVIDGVPQPKIPLTQEEKDMFRNYIQSLKPKTEL